MAEYFGSRVEDIFNTMEVRFLPEGTQDVDVTIGYNVSGEGGGHWKVTIKKGALTVEKLDAEVSGCTAILNAKAETFVGVTLGKIDAGEALSSGNISVDGDLTVLIAVLPKAFRPFTPIVRASSIIESMPERFRPDKAEGADMKIGYDLAGEGGGQWTVIVKEGACSVKNELDGDCIVTMKMDAQVFVDLNTGKLDGATAFTSGQVKIDGDIGAAGATAKFFSKFQAEGAAEEKGEELISLKCIPSIDQRYATGPIVGKWFSGLKEKKFIASKCPNCGKLMVPPREICAQCRVRATEFVEVGPEATVTLIDVVYYASPDPLTGKIRKTPYTALFMVFDGGSRDESFAHDLNPRDIDRIKPGMKVRPVWAEKRTGTYKDLLYFEIAD
ncbi:MAG: SCP2 sterol-binding domain-containing protein [Deltaproteobacteria bacterium]|nr:SCP2 sterol-binding domain-containing protein [Deltaproteobacteria bacterium]